MARLTIVVEGPTERDFVYQTLSPHLYQSGYEFIRPILIGNKEGTQGGTNRWERDRNNIINALRNPTNDLVSTMVDYYGLHHSWPGRIEARSEPSAAGKAMVISSAMTEDIASHFREFDTRRLIPFITMHEFEGLLFSAPSTLALNMGRPNLTSDLNKIAGEFRTPEDINDNYETCPSRRILDLEPRYQKLLAGSRAMNEIGLDVVRQQCPIFDEWLTALERYPAIHCRHP